MKRTMRNIALSAAVAVGLAAVPMFASPSNPTPQDLAAKVRHELVMIPYYGVFDDLNYSIDSATGVVTLTGDVVNPVVRTDAEHSVKRLAGVTQVVNNINVLPPSGMDNRIRRAVYRSVFGYSDLYRYAMGAVPSIHIVVDTGHVTLTGVVSTQADKDVAYIRANSVPGVFSVTNNLRVAEKS
ncbi:MAG TPA: BON domain-containing protein [Bryobacteraceae bacterium]|nr:BON domain-containing protein [Bryobacteraceae bacterium]